MSAEAESQPWIVLKFGGTSVSTKDRWENIVEIVQERLATGHRVLLVCSALSQVSNRLEVLIARASSGEDYAELLEEIASDHRALAADLGVGMDGVDEFIEDLGNLLEGIRLTHEITPRTQARILSSGELMSTTLGNRFLEQRGLSSRWLDAREILEAEPVDDVRDPSGRPYLSASCSNSADLELQRELEVSGERVFVTQGFIAGRDGETVLLGRGGSDTSGSYFAGLLEAERLEIWTDVPGLFSANPKQVPDAILLRHLPYRVAEELALRGGKVVHPAAIRAAENANVPVQVRWTDHPELEGTRISGVEPGPPSIKAVSMRKGIVAVSMRVDADWQPIGLIADLAACFKKRNLAIDLIASSPTNLTICLDLPANHATVEDLEPLLDDLRKLCRPRLIESTACISLVGSGIRALLHEWGSALRCFEDRDVHLVSQAANDRSVSFLVDEDHVDELVAQLHEAVLSDGVEGEEPTTTWQDVATGN